MAAGWDGDLQAGRPPKWLRLPTARNRRLALWFGRKALVFAGEPLVKLRMVVPDRPQYFCCLVCFDQAKAAGEIEQGAGSIDELSDEFILSVVAEGWGSGLVDCGQVNVAHPVGDVVGVSNQFDCLSVQPLVSLFTRHTVLRPRSFESFSCILV